MKNRIGTVLLLALIVPYISFAQIKKVNPDFAKSASNPLVSSKAEFKASVPRDTILFPSSLTDTCAATVFNFFNSDGWGFVGGMNSFTDLEKAQRFTFDVASSYKVNTAVAFFGQATAVGDGQMTAKIYDVDPTTGGPGNLLGTSDPLNVSQLSTSDSAIVSTIFTFSDSAMVSGNSFFLSFDFSALYNTNDTVTIFQTNIGCGEGNDSWELFGDGATWVPIDNANASWGIESNFVVGVVLTFDETTSSTEEVFLEAGHRILDPYPNPTDDLLTVKYVLGQKADVVFSIYDQTGRRITSLRLPDQFSGNHTQTFRMQDFPTGQYLLSLEASGGRAIRKIVVD